MLESLVLVLHLLTSTGLKSSADLRAVCGEFNPIFHTLLPRLLSVHCAGSWCCLEHCQHGHNITSQNLLHLESWNTWSSQSLGEREAVVSPGAALRVSCSGKNWNSLMKQQHFPWPLQKNCYSVLGTSSEPEVIHRSFISLIFLWNECKRDSQVMCFWFAPAASS